MNSSRDLSHTASDLQVATSLKPCPFCGGEAEILQIGNVATQKRGFEVKCKTWGCATKKRAMVIRHSLKEAEAFAIRAWNARAEPAAPDLLAALKVAAAALEEIAAHPGPNADDAAHWRADAACDALHAIGPAIAKAEGK